jgi:3-hydroxymyristoyl/3-hydroxydecanoyl-(acyl carrier protein) dehydratase
MSFLFVDSIQSISLDKPVEGTYLVPSTSPYFVQTTTGELVFMPSLVAEAVGQLGAWAVMQAFDFKKRPIAGVVSSVSMLGDVKPCDILTLKTIIDDIQEDQIHYHGEARVDGKLVLTIEKAIGPVLPMVDFIHEEVARHQCEERLSRKAVLYEAESKPQLADKAITSFDRILCFEKDKPVLAEKTLAKEAPFLSDHFPLKPVLPLSLFIHAKLQLAKEYINEFLSFSYKHIEVRKIKMGQFIQPGNTVSTEMNIKRVSDSEIIFLFRSFSSGKRACVCEARFY